VGIVTGLLLLPLAPLRGTVAIAEQVLRQAEEQHFDPNRIRRQLEEVERWRAAGLVSDEEAEQVEDELVERLVVGRTATPWTRG
jgi:chorismate mutase